MARSDGTVYVDTRIDTKGFQKGMNAIEKQTGNMASAFGKLGKVIAATFAISKIVQFGKKAIELGSDLQEVQNVVDVTFTTMSDKVDEFAKKAAESAGLSETMAKKYVGTFGAMAKSFGFAESEAFNMSTALTQLSGDVASFYNLTQDEAYTKLKSVFTGETESLKDLGVVMTQTALDSFAMAEGLGKTTKQMTEQEKVALRYRFVLNQLSGASGDFARTSDSWANQVRILKLNIESIMASVGQALINFFTPIIKLINVLLSKIATLANSFKAFSEMIMGKKSSSGGGGIGQAAADLADLESGYGGAADKAEDLASATKKADKANQKYLSGLDEIRTFTSKQEEGTGGIGALGGIAGSPVDYGSVQAGNQALEQTNSVMNNLLARMKELVGLFKKGFADGLGDVTSRLNTIKKAARSIKESLSYIFDGDVKNAFGKIIDDIAYSLGQITGSFASIGLSIGANLMGGIAKYLASDKGRIKNYLIEMMDITGDIMNQAGKFADAFAYVFEVISSESGQQITADLIGIFSNAFMAVTTILMRFGSDVLRFLTEPFIRAKESIRNGLQAILDGISSVTNSVRSIVSDLYNFMVEIYDGLIAPLFDSMIESMTTLYEQHIAPLMEKVGELFSVLGDAILTIWETVLKPFIQWFIENILPIIKDDLIAASEIFFEFLGTVADVTGGIIDALSGVINFITGVFTGDWQRAWEGIKSIFEGIFNAIGSIIERVLNTASSGLSNLAAKVNSFTSKIGIKIPSIKASSIKIPKLATGAVIPPNAPFMAMLGDQRHGTNIEAPLDTIKQAVREVVGVGSGGGTYQFIAQIDGKTIFESVISEAQLRQSSTGRNKLVTL